MGNMGMGKSPGGQVLNVDNHPGGDSDRIFFSQNIFTSLHIEYIKWEDD